MTLTPGTRLGPYEIIEPAGSGGMGDVYRARDLRLDREVAVKTIKGPFTERFEREAHAISSLNHPNICTLHDVGQHEGSGYLVMEFIEGKPIAGPLPVEQAVACGIQICEALHAAHRKGIIHRDLKPANILVTKQGVKLLDFGLAKLAASNSGVMSTSGVAAEQATLAALTGAHTVVGTPQYMAPEQIEAREVDARTDIFSFGCVCRRCRRPAPDLDPAARFARRAPAPGHGRGSPALLASRQSVPRVRRRGKAEEGRYRRRSDADDLRRPHRRRWQLEPAGVILFDGQGPDPLRRVDATGGVSQPVVLEAGTTDGTPGAGWPEFLPDGRHFLYTVTTRPRPGA